MSIQDLQQIDTTKLNPVYTERDRGLAAFAKEWSK